MNNIRVRFAPSPTGPLHIGAVRTALFNYLFAKHYNGQFILRIEDTDQNRYVDGAEQYILDALEWLGISPDEGMGVGGKYAPYKQSERHQIYQKYAQQLIDSGNAYYAFDTPEELENMRIEMEKSGIVHKHYASISRMYMNNSLTWSKEKVQKWIEEKKPYVIRFKVPVKGKLIFDDIIRERVAVDYTQIDDKVLMKSDGLPTYHLANVVDDYCMEITHVIRGEEWLPSTPLHCLLYQAFGWQNNQPKFAHIPLILKPKGNGKLSKRDAEKEGFPIFPIQWTTQENKIIEGFREKGFLPLALVNFLAMIGWNEGTERELYDLKELSNAFTLDHIHKAGAKFDIDKAIWFNQKYLKKLPLQYFVDILKKTYPLTDNSKLEKIAHLYIERLSFSQDIIELTTLFFIAPTSYDAKITKKKWTSKSVLFVEQLIQEMKNNNVKSSTEIQTIIENIATKLEMGIGSVMPAIRLCMTGVGRGADLMEILSILGTEECEKRFQKAIKILGNPIHNS